MVVAEGKIYDPIRATRILESELLSRCSYFDQYMDCDGCPQSKNCWSIWDKFTNTTESKPVRASQIKRVVDKKLEQFRQTNLPLKS